MPDIDLSFFDAVQQVWSFFFGFFPSWFQLVMGVCLGIIIAAFGIKLAKLLKDLFWPF